MVAMVRLTENKNFDEGVGGHLYVHFGQAHPDTQVYL